MYIIILLSRDKIFVSANDRTEKKKKRKICDRLHRKVRGNPNFSTAPLSLECSNTHIYRGWGRSRYDLRYEFSRERGGRGRERVKTRKFRHCKTQSTHDDISKDATNEQRSRIFTVSWNRCDPFFYSSSIHH